MVKSPCVKSCKLVNGKCQGCKRTLDEIVSWNKLSDSEKVKINSRVLTEVCWPDLSFPPINLYVLHSARWNK